MSEVSLYYNICSISLLSTKETKSNQEQVHVPGGWQTKNVFWLFVCWHDDACSNGSVGGATSWAYNRLSFPKAALKFLKCHSEEFWSQVFIRDKNSLQLVPSEPWNGADRQQKATFMESSWGDSKVKHGVSATKNKTCAHTHTYKTYAHTHMKPV